MRLAPGGAIRCRCAGAHTSLLPQPTGAACTPRLPRTNECVAFGGAETTLTGYTAPLGRVPDTPHVAERRATPSTPSGSPDLVERYLIQDMRGRYVVHQDVFEVVGRHLPDVPGIDGTPAPSAAADVADLEPFTVPEDDSELLAWVLDYGGMIPYDGDLQYRPDPLHRIVLADGGSIVVVPGDRLLGGDGAIHLAVPDHPADT